MGRVTVRRTLLASALATAALLLAGCAGPGGIGPGGGLTPTLAAVLVDEQLAPAEEAEGIEVLRAGEPLPVRPDMTLRRGDEVRTGPRTVVLLRFGEVVEVLLRPASRITIGSLELLDGEAFIRTLKEIADRARKVARELSGRFRVRTEYVAAVPEGTEFFVGSDAGRDLTVTVFDGQVRLTSRVGAWEPVTLGRFERAYVPGREPPQVGFADAREFNRIVDWANRMFRRIQGEDADRLVPAVAGLPVDEAEQAIDAAGLTIGRRYHVFTGRESVGTVTEQVPAPGTRMAPGETVDIGVEARSVRVPPLFDLARGEALRTLRERGLSAGDIRSELTPGAAADTVVRQSPGPGDVVPEGAAVDLVVAVDEATYCAENAGAPVANGTVLQGAGRSRSVLEVVNGTPRDALVKLKGRAGNTALAFYVSAGSRASVNTPQGSYRVTFATGRRFSRACGRFLEDMRAQMNPKTYDFGGPGTLTMTLHRVEGGTVRLQGMDLQDFLSD